MRTNIDNAICQLLRKTNTFSLELEENAIMIQTNDEVVSVDRIDFIDSGNFGAVTLRLADGLGTEWELMDSSTDDIIAVYEHLYHVLIHSKQK